MPSPEIFISDSGQMLWDWFHEISRRLVRTRDGVCCPIPPSEFLAWREATGNIVYPSEYAILAAVDDAYCDEMGKELEAMRIRQKEAAQNPEG